MNWNNINCCHVAIFLALFFGTAVIVVVGLFLGYTVKISREQIELKKKNGKEQEEINELKKKAQKSEELEQRFKNLEKLNNLLLEKVLSKSELESRN